MNKEEKEAIERLDRKLTSEKFTKNIGMPVYIKDVEIVLNLIEKQSKEIEGLKVRNNKLAQCHFRYEEMTGIDLLLPDKLEYTSNDKIKAKIEEVQKRLEEETRTDFLIILRILENELQSLLEKE